MDRSEARYLIVRYGKHAGLTGLERKAVDLWLLGMTIRMIGATLATNHHGVEKALDRASIKLRASRLRDAGDVVAMHPNRLVTEPATFVDLKGQEQVLLLRGGAEDERLRLHPTLVAREDLSWPLEHALIAAGL